MRSYKIRLERDELHEALGGELPAGSIIYVEGESGSGKTLFVERLLYGLLRNGYTVSYISTEMSIRDFLYEMHSLDYGVVEYLLSGSLLYIPVYPLIGNMDKKGNFLSKLLDAYKLYSSDIILIDTFSFLTSRSLDSTERSGELLSFFKKISAMGKTVLLTSNPEDGNTEIMSLFRASAGIYMVVESKMLGGSMKHLVYIKRFMNARKSIEDVISFRVEPNVGMIIEITSVS